MPVKNFGLPSAFYCQQTHAHTLTYTHTAAKQGRNKRSLCVLGSLVPSLVSWTPLKTTEEDITQENKGKDAMQMMEAGIYNCHSRGLFLNIEIDSFLKYWINCVCVLKYITSSEVNMIVQVSNCVITPF